MAFQINGTNVSNVLFNGSQVDEVKLDGTSVWTNARYMTATGGAVTTVGDYKIHTFTSGTSTFTVTDAGNASGSNSVQIELAGAGGGGGGCVSDGTTGQWGSIGYFADESKTSGLPGLAGSQSQVRVYSSDATLRATHTAAGGAGGSDSLSGLPTTNRFYWNRYKQLNVSALPNSTLTNLEHATTASGNYSVNGWSFGTQGNLSGTGGLGYRRTVRATSGSGLPSAYSVAQTGGTASGGGAGGASQGSSSAGDRYDQWCRPGQDGSYTNVATLNLASLSVDDDGYIEVDIGVGGEGKGVVATFGSTNKLFTRPGGDGGDGIVVIRYKFQN